MHTSERVGEFRKRFHAIRAVRSARMRILSRPGRGVRTGPLALRALTTAILVALFFAPSPLPAQYSTADMASGSKELIGQPAPVWLHRGWVNSEPLELKDLRGKIVLIRFFGDNPTGAAALRFLHTNYRDQGLAVIGFYVSSPMPTAVDAAAVRNLAEAVGFNFPVANDSQWQNVNRYWLTRADAESDSVTFLIDRKGIIRYIQPDGRYEKDSRDRKARGEFEKLEKQIQTLLQEPLEELPDGG